MPLHEGVPVDVLQTLHPPHDVTSDSLMHAAPPQLTCPLGQAQLPFWHVFPPVHTFPHDPQLLPSVCSLTHAPLQFVYDGPRKPPPLQLMPHDVPLHVALPFAGTGHAVHDVPHGVAGALLATHDPPQLCLPEAQHPPVWHVPLSQAFAHEPQLPLSVCSLTHAPLHSV